MLNEEEEARNKMNRKKKKVEITKKAQKPTEASKP